MIEGLSKQAERRNKYTPRIDHDLIAMVNDPEDVELTSEYLIAAIVSRCLMERGQPPEELE